MSYQQFAYLYDDLMRDIDYSQWITFIKEMLQKNEVNKEQLRVLDLACGTGELSVRLAKEGYDVTGIDLSEDMLSVAQAKAMSSNKSISFYQQNMAELAGHDPFDVIIIFCDSLNYLPSSEEVQQTFQRVFDQLVLGGLFMFDIHSIYKMEHIFMDQTFVSNDEDISFIWNCYPGQYPYSVEHDLSFFVKKDENSEYIRYDEVHEQRTFPVDDYKTWLSNAGFTILEISADFNSPLSTQSERILFTVKK
ncbi:class I SAM-dependent methyltransferase [Cytobacillus sp. S13-E01]|uniref:class I SAM-dependent DNA methyltransferase n=1 Tax=Cytobacillus sp. S13-E01 TaxID=3031326 RepID=UPI0023D8C92A|nr:class I SAM-dependent methyltransferase [Cytobacillus sp. S13-E01]MDF0728560.1 class I SAM-dependent methyltransferase [Cytobacillus sp. S13-E01]